MPSNKDRITTALVYMFVLTNVLVCGIFVLVGEIWPPEASIPSKVLSVFLATLLSVAVLSIMIVMVWRKQDDGTYIFDYTTRRVSIGMVLILTVCAILVIIVTLFRMATR